jgi:TolB protein
MKKLACAFIFVTVLASACGKGGTATPTLVPGPPIVTRPISTSTLEPAATPIPPTLTPSPTSTPEPALGGSSAGLIAFYSERDGNPEIYIMNADGSGLKRLTDDPAHDVCPALSSDGSQIAFLTSRHDPDSSFPNLKYEIYVMSSDGSHPRRLTTTDAAEDHPAWSPDGSRLTFDADYDGDGYAEIYAMDPDGTNLIQLTSNQANDQFADWSPDGTQIAFSSDRDGDWNIYVMNVADALQGTDGSHPRALTDSPLRELFPAWSPDGAQIAFAAVPANSRNVDVYVMNVADALQGTDGGNVRQLTDTPYYDEDPAWSPDGKHIVFQSERNRNFEIYVMNADGSEQRPLTNHRGDDFWPSWGPALPAVVGAPFSLEKSLQTFETETFQVGLGDLDGDGDLDAVFANPQRNHSEVWLNDGHGLFVNTAQQLTQYGHGVGVADFDGDGDLDAFIACHQFVEPSKIYLNDGHANFQNTGQDLGDARSSAAEVNLLDLNGDGQIDVHVLYYDPNGLPDKVYLNDGHANFTDSGLALDEETIAWGDLDGDGDVDYFGKRWGQGYVVQLNDGSGQFTPGWQMDDSQSTVGGVALADFDGDGDLDALVTNGFRRTGSYPSLLLWNDASGQFTDSGQRLNETMGAEAAVGDLDGDGDLDVFVTNMDLPNQVWLNDGGQFRDSGLRLGENSDVSGKTSLGDLDGDGDLDVFVGRFSGGAEIWFNSTFGW